MPLKTVKRPVVVMALTLAAAMLCCVHANALQFKETGASCFGQVDTDLEGKSLEGSGIQFLFASKFRQWGRIRMDLTFEIFEGLYWDYAEGFEVCLIPGVRAYLPDRHGVGMSPYVEAGLGLSYTNLDIPELGLQVNFRSFGGLGLRIPILRGWNLDLGCRMTHISNAGLDERNHGTTSVMPMVGLMSAF